MWVPPCFIDPKLKCKPKVVLSWVWKVQKRKKITEGQQRWRNKRKIAFSPCQLGTLIQKGGVSPVTNHDRLTLRSLGLVYKKNVGKSELWATAVLGCWKQSLLGDFAKALEEQRADTGQWSMSQCGGRVGVHENPVENCATAAVKVH